MAEYEGPRRRWGDGEDWGSRLAVVESEQRATASQIAVLIGEMRLLAQRIGGRPSWGVTTFISLSSALNVGLLVDVVLRAGGKV